MDNRDRITELENLIINAKKKYYSLGNDDDEKEFTDAEYDLLEEELRKLDPNNKVLSMVGITEKVDKFKNVEHKKPMLSMDKAHTFDDINSWYRNLYNANVISQNEEIIIEPKIDGISGDMYFENGEFVRAATRGNGHIGFEIKSEFLSCIVKEIPEKRNVHIRGEFYIPKLTDFEHDDSDSLRNICSGALKRKEYGEIHKYINFIAYQVVFDNEEVYETESEKIKFLEKTDFDTVPCVLVNSVEKAWKFFEDYERTLRNGWKYETDGIVLTFNSIETQERIVRELGDNDHHHKYAIAIKPKPEGAWTELIDVEWTTSRTGRVVPVGIIKPVEICSAVISRATLNNYDYIKSIDAKLFDRVYCVRANDVIPKITKCVRTMNSRDISIDRCPSCGTPLIKKGVDLVCNNYLNCPSQRINIFLHWFEATGIKNIGVNSLNNLINAGHFYAIWELYAMSREDLANVVERFCNIGKETPKMKEFLDTFEESKNQTEQEVIGNYGIPAIGIKSLEKLNIYDLDDLIKFKDIRYQTSDVALEQNLCNWLNKDEKNFDDLFSLIKFLKPKKTERTKVKKNKFCITGNFKNKQRNTVIKEIENKYPNWEFVNNVTKETDLLIIGNESGLTNKSLAATRLKIPMIKIGEIFDIENISL